MALLFAPPASTAAFLHRRPGSAQTRRFAPIRATASAPCYERPVEADTLYGVLGLRMGATQQELKAAYRKRARACHPDSRVGSADAGEFMRVHDAYSTLSDPAKRADYDRGLLIGLRPRPPAAAHPRSPCGGRRTWETDQCW